MALFGRELEQKHLAELIDGVRHRGGALVVRGEAGVGKSALLAEVRALTSGSPVRVLATAGVEAEQHLPYAGTQQLLFPLRAGIDALAGPQRAALRAALGLADDAVPDVFLVGLAALDLLAEAASAMPLVLVVEDAHRLDRASADVLAFVARRLESEPIVLVASVRDGAPSAFDGAGLAALTIEPLPADAAAELLDAAAPGLAPTVRARVLAEAAGNPLALTELPRALQGLARTGGRTGGRTCADPALPPVLPLTARLERAFIVRATALPGATRTALLVAALDDGASLADTLAATAAVLGAETGVAVLEPAADAGLVDLGPGAVTFRHPLMRSAVVQAAAAGERRAAHRALAATLSREPDRRAWHRAAATDGTDEAVAAELERAAERAGRRAGVAAAVAALEESARLSDHPGRRGERLLQAAALAVESGRGDVVERLVREAAAGELPPRGRAMAAWLPSAFDDGLRDPTGPVELAALAEEVAADGDGALAMRILWSAAMRCFWSEPGAAARRRLLSAADRLPVAARDPRMLAIAAYVAPVERGPAVVAGLGELAGDMRADPQVHRFLGSAALQVGAFDLAARFSTAAAPGLRAEGRLGLLTRALAVHSFAAVRLGDIRAALPSADEAARLARETGQPFMYGLARAVQAQIAALRGEYPQAAALAGEAEHVGLAAGARPVLATAQLARALTALGDGRHADAVDHVRRVHDPADPAHQIALRCYTVAELAEAAVRSDRDSACEIVADLEEVAAATPAPALHIGLRYARAVLAPGDDAEGLYRSALDADLTAWPLERARLQLAFGEWLRRRRRAAESRLPLRAARETFDALGVTAWGERARQELRAAGETSPRRDPDAADRLTAHELNIARLAADGLTNREIGQRLYLSHRTVSTHLHRIFPKLGITSRAELATALRPRRDQP